MTTLRDMLISPIDPTDQTIFTDAARHIALTIATSIDQTSDSMVDTHFALAATLNELVQLIYGYDQTMDENEALQHWLDTADAEYFYMASYDANLTPSGLLPALFAHFNPDSDALYGE